MSLRFKSNGYVCGLGGKDESACDLSYRRAYGMPVIFSVMVHVITIEAVKAAAHLDQVRHVKIMFFNTNNGMLHTARNEIGVLST
jgi:hypothetical protein